MTATGHKCSLGMIKMFSNGVMGLPPDPAFLPTGLALHAPILRGPGLIPGKETRFHMLQLRVLDAATKTQHSQVN